MDDTLGNARWKHCDLQGISSSKSQSLLPSRHKKEAECQDYFEKVSHSDR